MMTEDSEPQSPVKTTVAVIKGGPEFHAWFGCFQKQLRLPAALLLDAALVEFARAKGFEEPPQR
jgi:hypothetical protein